VIVASLPGNGHAAVLVIDDDPDIRDALTDILESEGYSVAGAAHGGEALALLHTLTPELILLDLNMPVMNGFQFRTAQRRDPRLALIPTVVMSAIDRMQERLPELAIEEALAKPLDLGQLLAVVGRYCHGGSSARV
jgi:CheY-like chemotaxis protein